MTDQQCKVCEKVSPDGKGGYQCILGRCRRRFVPVDRVEYAPEQLPVVEYDPPHPLADTIWAKWFMKSPAQEDE